MHIDTSRFGSIEVDPDQVLTFTRGLVGFAELHRFVLIQEECNQQFLWLQSLDDAEVAFLVTDPTPFFRGYSAGIREETVQELDLADERDRRLLAICNKVGDWLTANLLGPIVINQKLRLAQQIVLTEKKWMTRQPLAKLVAERRLAKAA